MKTSSKERGTCQQLKECYSDPSKKVNTFSTTAKTKNKYYFTLWHSLLEKMPMILIPFRDVWDTRLMLPCMLKSTHHCAQIPPQWRTAAQVLLVIIRFASRAYFDLHPQGHFQGYTHVYYIPSAVHCIPINEVASCL